MTKKTLEDKETPKVNLENFANEVKPCLTEYGRQNVYNSHQSEFHLNK